MSKLPVIGPFWQGEKRVINMLRRGLGLWIAAACVGWLPGLLAENSVGIGQGSAAQGEVAEVPLLVSGDADIQGFVLAFEWRAGRGTGLELVVNNGAGQPLEDADLIVSRVEDTFMVFSAVLDTDGAGPEVLPAGDNIPVGVARIQCPASVAGTVTTPIELVDDKYAAVDGGPALTNLIVSNETSITAVEGLGKNNGSFTCIGDGPPPDGNVFACGGALGDDGNPAGSVPGALGTAPTVNFYYKAEDEIQGLSMAVVFDCTLTAQSFDVAGGVLAEVGGVGAEFINIDIDNVARGTDGDGCEFILGVLVDATAPFDGRTLPVTGTFRKLFSLDFLVEEDATCNHCLWVMFTDGLDGSGVPPVKNLVAVDFQSKAPGTTDCEVCVEGEGQFIRGDCNFSSEFVEAVNIADAAAMVGFFFLEGANRFDAPCEDACDANDDGRLDAADVVFILEYMFVPNSPVPADPGPLMPGPDPTDDELGCDGGPKKC